MAYRVLRNARNGFIALNCVGNTGNVIVVGNNTVSNIATQDEVVSGAGIRSVTWATDANIQISRGANVVMILTQSGCEILPRALTLDPAANLVVSSTSANSWLMIELNKLYSNSSIGTAL